MSDWYWLSTTKMTVGVRIDSDGVIRETPPVVRKFIGQPLANLRRWMSKQPGFRIAWLP